ncbi:GNAT family N-acetyltransferase [Wenjunlia tyrosinilytica]|uniref:SPBc2 prophage-derived uncharacterized N-acetyltransferase YokL n=1 Tax=Wenjunlia tyrosinilytica TaxID=1544741 RepID=A0A917ZK10_9ACTN|nr:GNAT family protein [Wenjunlia tyrosinilytica]GGO85240.1 SPBc2 prophage-derived uncharacterized N-acetyltransferase YokL [Wenjunlia tyrosinilytica]
MVDGPGPAHHSLWENKHIRLRGFKADDWPYFSRFEKDSNDARSVFRIVPPRADEAHEAETAELVRKPVDEDCFSLAIESRDSGEIAGAISVIDADRRAGRFTCGLAVDRDHRRRGYATEAVLTLLRYMFDERRFHKCEVYIYAFNTASLALHEKIGFTQEGRLREREFFEGHHWDVVVMGITSDEYRERRSPVSL